MRRRTLFVLVAAALGSAASCGGDDSADLASADSAPTASSSDDSSRSSASGTPVIDPGDGGDYEVDINPADFTSVVDNPYLPMLVGAVWKYEETNADGDKQIDAVEVLDQHRTVMGVDTIVVHDVAKDEEGTVVEDTYDWYAQDSAGNVWYFGEDTTAYEEGQSSTEGSWEAGVDGALPGIIMPAAPSVSNTGYRQEYLAGVAEDMGQVIAGDADVTVPFGTFDDVVHTRDWSPLEPDLIEQKTYARSIGVVREETVRPADEQEVVVLVDFTPPR